jgi:hypothetical protein
MSSGILRGGGGSPALLCAGAVCVDIVEVSLHQLKNCAGNATSVKMWAKINPQGGGGNESPWLISLYFVHMHPHTHIRQQLHLWLPFLEIYNGLKENI